MVGESVQERTRRALRFMATDIGVVGFFDGSDLRVGFARENVREGAE